MENFSTNNKFDAMKITKYFKDQVPCLNLSSQFEDPSFPPNDFSLIAKDLSGNWIGDDTHSKVLDVNNIVWKSAQDIFGGAFNLFDDKIECDDIKQGSLGNCYFLSSLASLTEFPTLIYNIFRTKEKSKYGYYEVVLFIEGEWQIVIVDDFFPVHKNNTKSFYFSKPNGNELWAVLLEKAWAKVNGGYRNTIAGKENEALNALTGFPAERYDSRPSVMPKEELWELVKKSDNSSNVMCCTTVNDNAITDLGLVALHAYTLVGYVKVVYNGKEENLVKIRNPWGRKEWTGKWSDKSEIWTADLRKQANVQDVDDGIFHMSLDDFHKYFNYISICAIMPNSNVKTFKYSITKSFSPAKVYNINLRKNGTLAVGAIDRHFRFTRNLKKGSTPLFIILARYRNDKVEFIDGDMSFNTSVDLIKDLEAGNYLLWVWNDIDHADNIFEKDGQTKNIKIIFTSDDKFYAKEQSNDVNFDLLKQIIYQGVVSNKKPEEVNSGMFTAIENMFAKTGFGYRLVKNNHSNKLVEWDNDISGIQAMNMLKPYNSGEKFIFTVFPNDFDLFIACRQSLYGKYWFNVKSTYKTISIKPDEQYPITNNNTDYYHIHCDDNIGENEININYYDYCSDKLNNDQPDFHQEDLCQVKFEEFKKKYPKEISLLEKFAPHPDEEKQEPLQWNYIKFENGFYLGQLNSLNQRHGRGIYIFSSSFGYYGHWSKNVKCGKGVAFAPDFKTTYEGEYKDNNQHGKGRIYISNGDVIEATLVNGIKEGKGTYYWKNGSNWEGAFKGNVMHGSGKFTNANGKAFTVEYENGKQKIKK